MLKISEDWAIQSFSQVYMGNSLKEMILALKENKSNIIVGFDQNKNIVGYLNHEHLLELCLVKELNEKIDENQFTKDYHSLKLDEEIAEAEIKKHNCYLISDDDNVLVGVFSQKELQEKYRHKRLIFVESVIEHAQMGFLAIDKEARINVLNKRGRAIAEIDGGPESVHNKNFSELYDDPSILDVLDNQVEQINCSFNFDDVRLLINRSPVYFNEEFLGVVSVYEDHQHLEEMSLQLELVQNLNKELSTIVDSIYDAILVVSKDGTILRISDKNCYEFWGVEASEILNSNLFDLEKKGLFKPSVTRYVIENNKKVSVIQENQFGRKILAVGNPVFDESGKLDRVVIASRDITEIAELKKELQEAKSETEKYKIEVELLKSPPKLKRDFVFKSQPMKNLFSNMLRIAKVDSTVLIYGESGVGKEVIVENIHHMSNSRKNHPFIKVNCGAIPENLLESELFGYEKGSFTGALSKGRQGMFELANKGTLFLDEIGEMPLNLQVKLLQAIQDLKIMRIGGSSPIPVDIRIIVATNKNLEDLIEKNLFREDLYYRLAVLPLYIPPLRERSEDIEALVYYFLQKLNEKYQYNKFFSEDAIDVLKAYHWPGNVRELQNIVERAVVSFGDSLITAEDLISVLFQSNKVEKRIRISKIMPLKTAQDMVEEQLLKMALNKYKSTTQIAKVLEVSQATAWRKIKNIKDNKNRVTKDD